MFNTLVHQVTVLTDVHTVVCSHNVMTVYSIASVSDDHVHVLRACYDKVVSVDTPGRQVSCFPVGFPSTDHVGG